jgi:hypothetical protein
VMRVSGHDTLRSGGEEEASLPQVPARNAQPAIRLFGVGLVGQGGILPAHLNRSLNTSGVASADCSAHAKRGAFSASGAFAHALPPA